MIHAMSILYYVCIVMYGVVELVLLFNPISPDLYNLNKYKSDSVVNCAFCVLDVYLIINVIFLFKSENNKIRRIISFSLLFIGTFLYYYSVSIVGKVADDILYNMDKYPFGDFLVIPGLGVIGYLLFVVIPFVIALLIDVKCPGENCQA